MSYRTAELQLLAEQMGKTARGIKDEKPELAKVTCTSCRQPRLRVGADGVCAKCLRGQEPVAGDPEPVVEPVVQAVEHGRDLFCPSCDTKPNARGIEELPDGTLRHRPCGLALDLAEPAVKKGGVRKVPEAVKAVRKASKPRRRPKSPDLAKVAPKSVEGLLTQLLRILQGPHVDVAVHLERHDVKGGSGWKLEVYVPGV